MAHEFEELIPDGHNYPTWALDIKISLAFHRILPALETFKFQALFIIRNHLHPDLKSEYVMEEEPHSLWVALKDRYEQ
jgi:hypothetical protein